MNRNNDLYCVESEKVLPHFLKQWGNAFVVNKFEAMNPGCFFLCLNIPNLWDRILSGFVPGLMR